MAQYISKGDLVTEIERRKQVAFGWMETAPNDAIEAEFELCDDILSFINTLEVKEVDLDEHQIADIIQNLFPTDQFIESETLLLSRKEAILFAKHFFELGMSVSIKAQKGNLI